MQKPRSKDNTSPNIAELEKEMDKLLVNKSNPERLKEVSEILDFFNYGIKSK